MCFNQSYEPCKATMIELNTQNQLINVLNIFVAPSDKYISEDVSIDVIKNVRYIIWNIVDYNVVLNIWADLESHTKLK